VARRAAGLLAVALVLLAPRSAGGADPAEGLVGQTANLCSVFGIPFTATVERAAWQEQPTGAVVIVVAQVTNTGPRTTYTRWATQLLDDLGRRADQAGPGEVDLTALATAYNAENPGWRTIAPGQSARHVWAFRVPADVQTLALVPNLQYPC
jgi:hypothetical protein